MEEKLVKMIGIVSDHGGFLLKNFLRDNLQKEVSIRDLGVDSETSVDYPVVVGNACRMLLSNEITSLIALCGTGIGASITANRFKGVRAALCHDEFTAEMSRRHNNANVLVLGGRVLGTELAMRIVRKWMNTDFEGGRHETRIQLLDVWEEIFDNHF